MLVLDWDAVDLKQLEHGCSVIYAGFPCFCLGIRGLSYSNSFPKGPPNYKVSSQNQDYDS